MVIDFHAHFTPEPIVRRNLKTGNDVALIYAKDVPIYTVSEKLFRIDEMIEAMDVAGIDMAVLSSGAGLRDSVEDCKIVNDTIHEFQTRNEGRITGVAHTYPLGGKEAMDELKRAVLEYGFKGVQIGSDVLGVTLDSEELYPFYEIICDLGIFLFVHPSTLPLGVQAMNAYDMPRSIGREFNLAMAVIRLINGGVLDRFPNMKVCISHLGGGLFTYLPRILKYQDKEFWGTADDQKHGRLSEKEFTSYFSQMYFDCAGFCGSINPLKGALLEIAAERLLFGTDYPQGIAGGEDLRGQVEGIKCLEIAPTERDFILGENAKSLLGL